MQKKPLIKGIVLAVAFWAVLIAMFMPLFGGENAFKASDKLFNTISKGSTHYIPGLTEDAAQYDGKNVEFSLQMEDETLATEAEKILSKAGLEVSSAGSKAEVKGDLGKVLKAALRDADDMFFNRGDDVKGRYGIEERRALFVWWNVLKAAVKSFNDKGGKENFAIAKFTEEINARGIEVGYNYYKIKPESVSSKAGILVFALIFYVVYTLWWGFAIYFLAEGFGLQLTGGKKKEV